MANIDPKTGERIPDNSSQIDPLTGERVGPAPKAAAPSATMTTVPPESWLHQAEEDLTQGGNRTVLGRIGGTMQGRGDKGFSGIDSGVSKGTANLMGSPELGLLHAGEAAQTIPDHPVKGVLGTIGGALEAAKLPGMVMAGPEAGAAIDAVPSTAYAGKLFNELNTALADTPVPLKSALQPLQRATEIGGRGSTLPKAVSDLLARSESPLGTDMSFPEARDYQGALSDLSASDKLAMNGRMRGGVAQLGKGLYSDIHAAASTAPDINGLGSGGDVYAQAMKEFRQASQLKDLLAKSSKYAIGAGAGAAGVEGIHRFLSSK